jgi:hypothetical protein
MNNQSVQLFLSFNHRFPQENRQAENAEKEEEVCTLPVSSSF